MFVTLTKRAREKRGTTLVQTFSKLCTFFYIISLNQLLEIFGHSAKDLKENIFNVVHGSVEIIDSDDNWSTLLFLESFIKNLKSTINVGLKASRDPELF